MKPFASKAVVVLLALAIFAALAPLNEAQVGSSITQVSTVPANLWFSVDGQVFTQAMGAIWPTGSKHTLFAQYTQYDLLGTTQYNFTNWQWVGGTLAGGNNVVVTADPSISAYQAIYTTSYALSVQYDNCPAGNCPSPGTVYVNGAPISYDQTFFISAGGGVLLQAYPNNGYVFTGWGSPTVGNLIQGFQQSITVNQPTTVYPMFQVARTINLASVPSGLQLLQDHTPITTPAAMQWGWNSVHTLGAVTQSDTSGLLWVFSSWSDGGAATHSYTVAPVVNPGTVTATFVPGALVTLATSPPGLNLIVDGQGNWPAYNFTWGVGQTHIVSAPAQQTDAQGHLWAFSSWSNSGPATQSITVPASAAANGLRLYATYTAVAHLSVTSALSSIAVNVNGSPCALPCDVYPPVGAQVDVGAPPSVAISPGSRQDLLSWSSSGAAASSTAANGDLLVTLGQSTVTASPVYHLMNSLAVSANPAGGATFAMQPSSPDGYYDSQATVTVKASVLPGYKFSAWSGDLAGPAPTGSVAMSAPRAAVAMLSPVPFIQPSGVVNGAGITPQAIVAPGSVVSVFGANLGASVAAGPSNPMVQTLGGVTARVGAEILPLYFVSPSQINFELPPDLPAGQQTLTVSSPGQPDATASFMVAADAPGIFPSTVANGVTYGLITHADGSAVTTNAPAQAGETLSVYGTGFGPTAPARPEGFAVPSSPAYLLTDPATVLVGGVSVTPVTAYALAGAVGVDVVQFVVPDGLPSASNSALTITVNQAVSNTVQLPIQ
jgi:uncharacterized protein (TIGR03437 family)